MKRATTPHRHTRPATLLLATLTLTLAAGCAASAPAPMRPEVQTMVAERDALAVVDDLERLVDEERDTPADREAAYEAVLALEEDTAPYAFARAAVAGRLAQVRGLSAIGLVREMERYALRSWELDPTYRRGEARRMLGTLYVLAPSFVLSSGNAEQGIALLKEQVQAHPRDAENHLRLAQGLIETGAEQQAAPYLCEVAERQETLRAADRRLLYELMQKTDPPVGAACVTSATTTF